MWLGVAAAPASDLTALARIDATGTKIETPSRSRANIVLSLSNGVPFRAFTLAQPNRLILDFQDIDWRGLEREMFLRDGIVRDVRFGVFQPGWSRIVFDLETPLLIKTAGLKTRDDGAVLTVALEQTDQNQFDLATGAGSDALWTRRALSAAPPEDPRKFVIAIDPGHGGVDPGAVREGIEEKDLVLDFSQELANMISASGAYEVFMTRTADEFVSLDDRVRLAREADADLFLSIHVNTVTFGDASGASVNTLSDRASDVASAKLAELENRADASAGLSTFIEEDGVARVLIDLARTDTNARSKLAASSILKHLKTRVRVLRSKPHRHAGFKVLKAHDIPSVLIELGFMSNARDRENIQSEDWRKEAALSILSAIDEWVLSDAARQALIFK